MDPAVLERLATVPLREYGKRALKIANKDGDIVPLDMEGRPGQIKLVEAIERQEKAGMPVRIILVKSRQFGGSTGIQAYLFKKATTRQRRRILTVAQRMKTAGHLFGMCDTMNQNLPPEMQHPIGAFSNKTDGDKVLHFGERHGGFIRGHDSKMSIATAEELGDGRGLTFTDMHLTECAHWRDEMKALDLLPAVPKRPGTSIFLESTANGMNWFHQRAMSAKHGLSEFELVFVGWHEDPDCVRQFRDQAEREAFIAGIGDPRSIDEPELRPIVEDEPWLVEEFGCTPEQLYFRRTIIVDECAGKVERFKQEYPATVEEAFVGSGRQVFSIVHTARAAKEAERWSKMPPEEGGPQRGIFVGEDAITRHLSDGTAEVPQSVRWVPEAEIPVRCEWWPGRFYEASDPLWTLWLPTERTAEEWRHLFEQGAIDLADMEAGIEAATRGPGQYIIAGDAAKDTYNDIPSQMQDTAFNTLVGIDHWTGVQVAEWRGRVDHDLVACQAFLAGKYLNLAWLSTEIQGGYGEVIVDRLARRFYYPKIYMQKRLNNKKQREVAEYGWLTNKSTKPRMEGTAQALLREGSHGIRSPLLAAEFATYIKDEKNPIKHEPMAGAFSDLLLAWMQAQEIRRIKPPRRPPSDGPRPNSMTRRLSY